MIEAVFLYAGYMIIDHFITILDQVGITVFVISGALVAAKLRMDITSFIFLGMAAGLGGGTLRDLLLGRTPVFWISDPDYFTLCLIVASITYFVAHWLERVSTLLLWFDAAGMALFAIIGTQISLDYGTTISVALLMGVITASFGGLIRDIMAGQPSILFQKNVYMTAALAGCSAYIIMIKFTEIDPNIALVSSAALTFMVRGAGILFDWRVPSYKWIDKS